MNSERLTGWEIELLMASVVVEFNLSTLSDKFLTKPKMVLSVAASIGSVAVETVARSVVSVACCLLVDGMGVDGGFINTKGGGVSTRGGRPVTGVLVSSSICFSVGFFEVIDNV